MAGIDKTYIDNYQDYRKVIDWAKTQSFQLKDNITVKPYDFIWYPDITESEWNKMKESYLSKYPDSKFTLCLWNTPIYLDIWLIRNCPFDFIQDRLKEQYGFPQKLNTTFNDESTYTLIKEYNSIYDKYQRNGLGKKAKVTFHNISGSWVRDKNCLWWIEVNPVWIGKKKSGFDYRDIYDYYDENDSWYRQEEGMPWTSNVYIKRGTLTKKNIVNLIKKWNFPKGTIVKFICDIGRYQYHHFYCVVNG